MAGAIEVAKLVVPLIAETDDFERGLSRSQRIAQGFGRGLQSLGKVALGGLGMVATGATAAIGGIANLAMQAAPVEGLQSAFEGLTSSFEGGADAMLSAMQDASSGMIANRDLMESFNKAASLVSKDFAQQLPDAMQYLGKVSASTGQDMGFLMDSLVTGVGRLSPMILDNLGIQVSLSEATARAAEMFGVEASELTKAQQQAGMTNVVMEKLAANTADMPDVSESAAAGIARMRAQFQNTKDEIGMAFLPILQKLLDWFQKAASKYLPPIIDGIKILSEVIGAFMSGAPSDYPWEDVLPPKLADLAYKIAGGFETFIGYIKQGHGPLLAFQAALGRMGFADIANRISQLIMKVGEFRESIQPIIDQIIKFVTENVQLKDILAAIGIAIASVVLPALWGIIAPILAVAAAFVGLVAIITALRTAWENDFMGIRTALTEAWEGTIKPALMQLWAWLQTNIPIAIQTLSDFWTNTLQPAIQAVMAWIQGTAIPIIQNIWVWLQTTLPAALQTLSGFWTNVLQPALELVWGYITNSVIPLWQSLAELATAVLGLAIEVLAGIWQNVLQPALRAVWTVIQQNLLPGFTNLRDFIAGPATATFSTLANTVLPPIRSAFAAIGSAIQRVIGWVTNLTDKINNVEIPDWLKPGSPPPLYHALMDIGDAMEHISRSSLPSLAGGFDAMQTVTVGGSDIGGAGGRPQVIIYGLTIEGVSDAEGLLGELQALAV